MRKSLYTPEYKRLLTELRNARAEAGLTQRDLGARLKVPHSWVAKVESGERRIDLIEFSWLLAACGVDPNAAFGRIIDGKSAGRSLPRGRR